jgi:DNA-binding response OmpR family regulator
MNQPTNRDLILIVTESDWAGRSLESELMDHGYSVLRTQDANGLLDLVHRAKPDAVIVDQHLRESSGIALCRALNADPRFDAATPIIMIGGAPSSQTERTEAYEAGVWSFATHPLDSEILRHELATFLRARKSIVSVRENSLGDASTGLLSASGMDKWAEHLAARALRNKEPLACVVLMAPPGGPDETESEALESAFVEASRSHMRQSDIVGMTGEGRIALLAPATDSAGVGGLLQRLRSALEAAEARNPGKGKAARFRAGYATVDDFATSTVPPADLIRQATRALEYGAQSTSDLDFDFSRVPLS